MRPDALNPPDPPPPPIDCAEIPIALSPVVPICVKLPTVTAPALFPVPPLPPSPIAITFVAALTSPPTAKPPLPPPPPIDCARIPSDASPLVVMPTTSVTSPLLTMTVEAVLPLPPAPPSAAVIVFAPVIVPATLNPPLPPPPPIDCATIPEDETPIV